MAIGNFWGRVPALRDPLREVMLQRQPSRQFATTEQLGGTVIFLCSDSAAQITGTTISVDGGWTAL